MYRAISFNELADLERIALDTAFYPFCQRVMSFVKYRKWYPEDFIENTGLDVNTYSKLKNGRVKRPDMRTLIAVFVGLRLPLPIVEDLLRSAGMAFTQSKSDRAYRYVILTMNGATIEECNAFLQEQGVPLLGSIAKDERITA